MKKKQANTPPTQHTPKPLFNAKQYCEKENLNQFPSTQGWGQPIPPAERIYHFGDTHGNFKKVLWDVCFAGCIHAHSDADSLKRLSKIYHAFVRLYNHHPDTVEKSAIHKQKIDFYLDCLEPYMDPGAGRMIWMGDTICERGKNDYYFYAFLNKWIQRARLLNKPVPIDILLSNHDIYAEIMRKGSIPLQKFYTMHDRGLVRSYIDYRSWIDQGIISCEEKKIFYKQFNALLKPLSYTIDKQGPSIRIASHAPIEWQVLRCLAASLGVPYQDATVWEMARSIDGINAEFKKSWKNGKILTLFEQEFSLHQQHHGQNKSIFHTKGLDEKLWIDPHTAPWLHLCWNRSFLNIQTHHPSGYCIHYIHGHQSHDAYMSDQKSYMTGTNNDWGRPHQDIGIPLVDVSHRSEGFSPDSVRWAAIRPAQDTAGSREQKTGASSTHKGVIMLIALGLCFAAGGGGWAYALGAVLSAFLMYYPTTEDHRSVQKSVEQTKPVSQAPHQARLRPVVSSFFSGQGASPIKAQASMRPRVYKML